jgi:hypothetical protein
VTRLERALADYLEAPTDDGRARALAAVIVAEASPSFLASMCLTLMRAPLVGPHDIAHAAAAAYHRESRERPTLAKCGETSSPSVETARGGSDVESNHRTGT